MALSFLNLFQQNRQLTHKPYTILMRRIIFIVFLASLAIFFLRETQDASKLSEVFIQNPTPSPLPVNSINISFNKRAYKILYEDITDKTLTLIPNFIEKNSAGSLSESNLCTVSSSGGFYTKENKPLGLYKKDGEIINRQIHTSSLLTGFLYQTKDGKIGISEEPPVDAPDIVQTGPLFESGRKFNSRQDEYARRIVVIEDTKGNEYIATAVGNENTFDGPLLSELPTILFSITSPFKVNRALNLDGGNASFFKSESGYTVSELVAVGSLLCFN